MLLSSRRDKSVKYSIRLGVEVAHTTCSMRQPILAMQTMSPIKVCLLGLRTWEMRRLDYVIPPTSKKKKKEVKVDDGCLRQMRKSVGA